MYVSQLSSVQDQALKDGLINRLESRRALLSAVQTDGILDPKRVLFWDRCLTRLPALFETHNLGQPVENSFSIKIQRKLTSSAPPRPMIGISFDDAFIFFTRLCQNGKDIYRVLEYHGGCNLSVRTSILAITVISSWPFTGSIQTFLWAYQSRAPQPPVFIRSLLQSFVFSEMRVLGTMSFKQLLFDDLDEIVLTADALIDTANEKVEAPQDPRFQIAKRMNNFITRAADVCHRFLFR